ncbi:MAG: hypothetical protein V2A77_01695 [Pseudomonadota bacterium]
MPGTEAGGRGLQPGGVGYDRILLYAHGAVFVAGFEDQGKGEAGRGRGGIIKGKGGSGNAGRRQHLLGQILVGGQGQGEHVGAGVGQAGHLEQGGHVALEARVLVE